MRPTKQINDLLEVWLSVIRIRKYIDNMITIEEAENVVIQTRLEDINNNIQNVINKLKKK